MALNSLASQTGSVRVDASERLVKPPAEQAGNPRQNALVAGGAFAAHLLLLFGLTRLDLTYAIPKQKALEIPVELITAPPREEHKPPQKSAAGKSNTPPQAAAPKPPNSTPKAEAKAQAKPQPASPAKPSQQDAKLAEGTRAQPQAKIPPPPSKSVEKSAKAEAAPAPKAQPNGPPKTQTEPQTPPTQPKSTAEAKAAKLTEKEKPPMSAAKAAASKPAAQTKPQAVSPAPPKLPSFATLSPMLGPLPEKMTEQGKPQAQDLPPTGPRLPPMSESFRAVAVPSPSADGDLVLAYKTLVFSKLELAKKFPEEARKRHAHGSAVIAFALDEKGRVLRVTLLQSSGDTALDVASLALVERAAPFPPPPPGAQREFAAVVEYDARH